MVMKSAIFSQEPGPFTNLNRTCVRGKHEILSFITVRKRRLGQGNVSYTCLSFCSQGRGWSAQPNHQGCVPPPPRCRPPPDANLPGCRPLPPTHMIKKRVVRIILECILVLVYYSGKKIRFKWWREWTSMDKVINVDHPYLSLKSVSKSCSSGKVKKKQGRFTLTS